MFLSEDKKAYFTNLASSYLPHFAQILVFIVITPLLLNTFGQVRYGVYVLLYTVIGYFGLTDIGLPQTFIREIINARARQDHSKIHVMINSLLRYYSIITAIIVVGAYIIFYLDIAGLTGLIVKDAGYINLFKVGIILISFGFTINFLSGIFEAIIMAENKIYVVKLLRLVQVILFGVVTYVLAVKTKSVEMVLAGNIAVNMFTLILFLVASRKVFNYKIDFRVGDWKLFKALLPSSFWYLMSGFSVIMIFQIDNIVISSVIGLSAVTVYSLMFRFTNFARQILSLVPNTLFPKVAKMFAEKKYEKIVNLHNKVLLVIVGLSVLTGILLYFPGYRIFQWWIGKANAGSINIFLVFILFTVFFSINQVSGLFLGAIGYHKNGVIVGLIQGAINLGLSIVLARYMGINGVIIATVVALVVTNLWFSPYYFYKVVKNENRCA